MPCHVPICNALVFFILKAAYFFSHEHPVNSQASFWGGLVCISLKQLLPHFFVSLVLMWMCRHFMSFEKTQINIFQHSVIIGGSSIICDTHFNCIQFSFWPVVVSLNYQVAGIGAFAFYFASLAYFVTTYYFPPTVV